MIYSTEYARSFWNALRRGGQAKLDLLDRSARHTNTGTYQLPADTARKYEDKLAKTSVFRQIATVVHAEESDSDIWTFDSDDAAQWVGDRPVDVTSCAEDFAQHSIAVHRLATMIRLGSDFAGALKFDIEDYLTTAFAKKFAKAEDAAFISGDGTDQPVGILTDEGGSEVGVTAADGNGISFDELTRLYFSVKPEYRSNAVWLMNDETALTLRSMKDDTGNFLWRGSPETLMGKPVVISNAMPSMAPGAKPVAFGDFSWYWIVVRFPLTVRVLDELFALQDHRGYLAYEFLDGKLIRPEAVKVLQLAV